MRIQNLLAISSVFILGHVGHSLARLDESDVPAQCQDVCKPVVDASQKCDRDVPDRETRMECKCTWIRLKTSGTVSNCNRCMHKRNGGDWNKRSYDSDDSDSSDDEDYDGNDMYQFCNTAATGTPVTATVTTSSTTSTMTMQLSASTSASTMGYESSDTTSSSSSPTSSSSSSTPNGADSLSMSASLAAIAGLAFFPWL